MLFWNKKRKIILLICSNKHGDKESGKWTQTWGRRGAEKDRCPLSLPCLSLCLSCERSAVVTRNLYFIHYSQLCIAWEQGTYHRPARGRERWKGHTVQLDQRESCTAKRANVHHGRVCAGVCVRARSRPCFVHCREKDVLMVNSQYSAVVPVEHICLNHWCWHAAHTCVHSHQIAASASFCGLKNERGHFLPTDISMPWQRKACGGGSDPGGHFDVAILAFHIVLLRTSWWTWQVRGWTFCLEAMAL